jgi:hypothetical protein
MRTLGSLRMRHRLIGAVVALALGCTVLVLSSAQPAQAATLGGAWSNGFSCVVGSGGRQVNAYPPQMTSVSGGLERVEWSPDLYRWNGTAWVLYDGTKPWYYAYATGNGTVYQQLLYGTWFAPNGTALIFASYGYLPAGYYMVAEYYRWYRGTTVVKTASSWSYVRGTSSSSCVFS